MIAIVDVSIQAANPSMPLYPWRAYLNSPSSLRIRNVPRRIGNWNIDKVYVTAAYPDNAIKSAQCVLVGGIWVCTIEGSTVSGLSQNGYTIYADGKDENGNEVTGYVLGKGDITILESDGTITPEETTYYVHMLSAQPTAPKEGDLWQLSGSWYIYQDGTAYPIGDDSGLIQQLSAEVQSVSATAQYAGAKAVEAYDVGTHAQAGANVAYAKADTAYAKAVEAYAVGDHAQADADNAYAKALEAYAVGEHGLEKADDAYTLATVVNQTLRVKADISSLNNYLPLSGGTLSSSEGEIDIGPWGAVFHNDTTLTSTNDSTIDIKLNAKIAFDDLIDDNTDQSLETQLSNKANLSTLSGYVALIPNSKDNVKNAVTIGTRKANSYIGERSFVFGSGCEASGPDTLAFGWQTSAVGQWGANFSIGENNICEGECSFALGSYAEASDDFAFTWNHTYSGSKYPSHGEGTFNVNPKNGLSGFYIGEQSLDTLYWKKTETSSATEISSALENKADISSVPTSADYVALIPNSANGNKNAVTIGSRKSGSLIGDSSFAAGVVNEATAAGSMAFGGYASATGMYGAAIGILLSAEGIASFAFGSNAYAKETYSFAWNGNVTKLYQSHGQGTFSINPTNGLSGFYIGEQSLGEIIGDISSVVHNM